MWSAPFIPIQLFLHCFLGDMFRILFLFFLFFLRCDLGVRLKGLETSGSEEWHGVGGNGCVSSLLFVPLERHLVILSCILKLPHPCFLWAHSLTVVKVEPNTRVASGRKHRSQCCVSRSCPAFLSEGGR